MAGGDAVTDEQTRADQDGIAHRVGQRNSNLRMSAATDVSPDAQGLIEFGCECTRVECDLLVRMPLDVYRRMVAADQYVLRRGHPAFATYRTIISMGLMQIEERA
jgi:transketolase N-terminal domain/subunit